MLLTTRRVEPIRKNEFVVAILNLNYKFFVVYVATFNISSNISDEVYLLRRAQIAHLKVNKTHVKFPGKYADFANVFLSKLTTKLAKYTSINNHANKLVDD